MEIPVFWKPTCMKVTIDGNTEYIEEKVPQNIEGIEDEGYQYEIAYVNECLRKGWKESPEVNLESSLCVLKQMDELRKNWGFVYPGKEEQT